MDIFFFINTSLQRLSVAIIIIVVPYLKGFVFPNRSSVPKTSRILSTVLGRIRERQVGCSNSEQKCVSWRPSRPNPNRWRPADAKQGETRNEETVRNITFLDHWWTEFRRKRGEGWLTWLKCLTRLEIQRDIVLTMFFFFLFFLLHVNSRVHLIPNLCNPVIWTIIYIVFRLGAIN